MLARGSTALEPQDLATVICVFAEPGTCSAVPVPVLDARFQVASAPATLLLAFQWVSRPHKNPLS